MAKTFLKPDEVLALDNCDAEPIHIPGHIQPFGALLAGAPDLMRIDYASANTQDILGQSPRALLGTDFGEWLGRKLTHDIRNTLSMSTASRQRERVGTIISGDKTLEVFAHRNPDGLAVIELEPVEAGEDVPRNPIDRMRVLLNQASHKTSIKGLLDVCVHGLRDLTGYDRVKAYRYAANGDGEVVAESRTSRADSFLGLHYPAWDVPKQAREMQIRNQVRLLSDIAHEPVPLLAASEDLPPLDMGLAHMRGVSPIHVEYMKNMNVGGSMTISLVVEGKLWGMFACHHMEPKIIRSDLRIAMELFGQLMSLVIQQRLEVERGAARIAAGDGRRRILADTDATADLLHAFDDLGHILQDVVESDGLAVIRDDKVQTMGSTPSADTIRWLATRKAADEDLLEGTASLLHQGWIESPYASNSLGETAGCLLIRCTAAYPLQLMFFRDGKTRKIKWAGRPDKDIQKEGNAVRLSPRKSFDSYMEQQDGWSEDWSTFDMEAGRELQILLTQITAKGERAQMRRHKDMVAHQRQQDLMIAELNHRVKNILALIRSLSRQAKSSSASLESYAQALEQRISALAAAHDLAVTDTQSGVSLKAILETELAPYANEESAQYVLSGPPVGLRPDVAPIIALVFHEVVTNAAKYGALSTGNGVVQARWSLNDEGLTFSWRELGGPAVSPPERQGFGRSLIERAIPYEFDGEATLAYPESGVTFDFTLPADTMMDVSNVDKARPSALVGSIGKIQSVASDRSVLLVEDNVVLAMDMMESLTELGAERVETCGTLRDAMRQIEKLKFDFAVLDMNLRGVVSFDLARKLREIGTPFLFVTGYGSSFDLPPELQGVPILTKPINDATLSTAIAKLLKSET